MIKNVLLKLANVRALKTRAFSSFSSQRNTDSENNRIELLCAIYNHCLYTVIIYKYSIIDFINNYHLCMRASIRNHDQGLHFFGLGIVLLFFCKTDHIIMEGEGRQNYCYKESV